MAPGLTGVAQVGGLAQPPMKRRRKRSHVVLKHLYSRQFHWLSLACGAYYIKFYMYLLNRLNEISDAFFGTQQESPAVGVQYIVHLVILYLQSTLVAVAVAFLLISVEAVHI